jgi:hypothetical protein
MGYIKDHDIGLAISKNIPFDRDFREQDRVLVDLLPDNGNVLDFGCYDGTFKKLGVCKINNKVLRIDGFDIDHDNVLARYHSFNEIRQKYDAIIASHVFEHIDEQNLKIVLKNLFGVSDMLIISMPNTDNIFYNFWLNTEHKQPYDNPDIFAWLDNAGWTVKRVIRATAFHREVGLIQNIFRFIINVSVQKSPFYNYMIVCKRKDYPTDIYE